MAESRGLADALEGDRLLAQGRFAAALQAYAAALEAQPDNPRWRFLAGETLFHLQRFEDTVALLKDLDPGADRALAIERDITLGRALQLTGQPIAAEAHLLQAFIRAPEHEEAAYNLAVFYEKTDQPAQAIPFLLTATQHHPNSVRLNYNLGVAYSLSAQSDASATAFRRVLHLDPYHARAHHNLALVLLRKGLLKEGWSDYAWRSNRQAWEGSSTSWQPQTPTLPKSLQGQCVEVRGEQGLGDELFFMRFLPALRARGAEVRYLCASAKLTPLMAQTSLRGYTQKNDIPAAFRLLAGDLPLTLGGEASQTYPAAVQLQTDTDIRANLQSRYPLLAGKRPRIGLTWRAGTQAEYGNFSSERWLDKSAPLQALLEILAPLPVDVVVLQRGLRDGELLQVQNHLGVDRVFDASTLDQDLNELLALLSCLDTLVGVSNTNVHLGAGLGLGGHILVPIPAEFRWQEGAGPSPWFPGFNVYRQAEGADWIPALDKLKASLESQYLRETMRQAV